MIGLKFRTRRISPILGNADENDASEWFPGWSSENDEGSGTSDKGGELPRDIEWAFTESVQKSLTNIDDTLDSMLSDSWEAFKPFVPEKVLRKTLGGKHYKASVNSEPKGQEVVPPREITSEISDFILMASVFDDPKMIPHVVTSMKKIEALSESMALLIKILKQRIATIEALKSEIWTILQTMSIKYPKTVLSARELWKDYDEFSHPFNACSPYKKESCNFLYFSKVSGKYSVICRSPNPDFESQWKFMYSQDEEKRQAMLQGVLSEMEESLSILQTVLKGSLNRTYLIMQNSEGLEHLCIKVEIMNLQDLLKSNIIRLPKPNSTTILFSLMRIIPKFNLMRSLLEQGIKYLQLTSTDLAKKKKSAEKLMKKIGSVPVISKAISTTELSIFDKIRTFVDFATLTSEQAAALNSTMSPFLPKNY